MRRYIRENLICDRNLPKNPSPCTSLIGLETELESMASPHYTGIRIYLNRCLAHSATNFSCDDSYIDTMFPNILNRLNLKHIWLWFSSEKEYQVCTLAVKLVQSLCAKYGNSLKKITVIIKVFPSLCHPKRDPTLLRKIFLAGDDEKTVRYTNTKTLSFDCEYFRAETQNFLHDLIKASPRLGRIKCPNVDIVPEGWKHLVKEMVLNGDESRQWKYIDAKNFEKKYELEYLMTFNCKFPDILLGFQEPSVIFEHLLWSSAESLKILSIRGSEFPRWSTNEKTPSLVNVEKLEIVTSLDDPLFLQEFGFICTVMCPGLKVVSIHHSLSMEGHRVERCENQGEIVPNGSVRTMRLEGFDREMDVMMCEFTKYFPNLTELHLIDCDGWGIQGIFNWTKLECIAFGRRNAYWTDNYDRFILGVESEEEMSELRKSWGSAHDLGNFAPTKPGLFSLTGKQHEIKFMKCYGF